MLETVFTWLFVPVTFTPFELVVYALALIAAVWMVAMGHTLWRCADMRLKPQYEDAKRELASAVDALRDLVAAYQLLLKLTANEPDNVKNWPDHVSPPASVVIFGPRGRVTTTTLGPFLRARGVLRRHTQPASTREQKPQASRARSARA